MSEQEKRIADNIAKACANLPESKREYLLGFAEGVAAVAERMGKEERNEAEGV